MIKFGVQDELWSDRISLRMKHEDRKAISVQMVECKPGDTVDPFLYLSREEAQNLVNQLYAAGIQPEQGKGSAGQLAAIKYHLEDMRKLVFKDG